MVRAMVDRPGHVDRALVSIERTAETFSSSLLLGDVQVVRGYVARLERQLIDEARPSLWHRFRRWIVELVEFAP